MVKESGSIWPLVVAFMVGGLLAFGVLHKAASKELAASQARAAALRDQVNALQKELAGVRSQLADANDHLAKAEAPKVDPGAPASNGSEIGTPDLAAEDKAKAVQMLKASLKDPDSLRLEEVRIAFGQDGRKYACIIYNAKNSFGGYGGNDEAIVDFTAASEHSGWGVVGDDDKTLRDLKWMAFCR